MPLSEEEFDRHFRDQVDMVRTNTNKDVGYIVVAVDRYAQHAPRMGTDIPSPQLEQIMKILLDQMNEEDYERTTMDNITRN